MVDIMILSAVCGTIVNACVPSGISPLVSTHMFCVSFGRWFVYGTATAFCWSNVNAAPPGVFAVAVSAAMFSVR
jgi:hypothetical protein